MHTAFALSISLVAGTAGIAVAQQASPSQTGFVLQVAEDELHRDISEWDLPRSGLAIEGYDPVAYFPEGGEKAAKGSKKITAEYRGVTYRFKTEANKALFLANPTRYEPAHGGWCSWAMIEGDKTEPDPKNFIVRGDRLFLFYKGIFGDTKKSWEKTDHDTSANQADASWKDISGEEKREVPEVE